MAARMAGHAQSGLTVVGVFYGHPGVFTDPSHRAVAIARGAGFRPRCCLECRRWTASAPTRHRHRRRIESNLRRHRDDDAGAPARPGAHVIIWQIGVLAQPGFDRRRGASDLTPLVDYLLQFYRRSIRSRTIRGPTGALRPGGGGAGAEGLGGYRGCRHLDAVRAAGVGPGVRHGDGGDPRPRRSGQVRRAQGEPALTGMVRSQRCRSGTGTSPWPRLARCPVCWKA